MRPYRGLTKDGKWVYGWYFHCSSSDTHNIHSLDDSKWPIVTEVLPKTVVQQTGLQEKNSKRELYAGDRVVIGNDRGVLVWDEYDLCWALELDEDNSYQAICRFYTHEEIDNIEYLGNIHTTPELLEESK